MPKTREEFMELSEEGGRQTKKVEWEAFKGWLIKQDSGYTVAELREVIMANFINEEYGDKISLYYSEIYTHLQSMVKANQLEVRYDGKTAVYMPVEGASLEEEEEE